MNLNLTSLKYFLDSAQEMSIIKAAQKNFVTQPAVSQGIKRLEEELKLELLIHQRNSLELTDAGHYLVEKSQGVFNELQNFEEAIQEFKKEPTGLLRICTSSSIAKNFVLPYLSPFTKKHPSIDLQIKFGKTSSQKKLIERNISEFGITIDDGSLYSFKQKPLQRGEFLLVSTKNASRRLLATEDRPEVQRLLKKLQVNSFFQQHHEIESWGNILNLVKADYGYGLLPDFLVKNTDKLIIQNKNFKLPKLSYNLLVVSKKERSPSKSMQLFTEFIQSSII